MDCSIFDSILSVERILISLRDTAFLLTRRKQHQMRMLAEVVVPVMVWLLVMLEGIRPQVTL
ncbi:hypothetical protein A8E97_07205 [Burkholderia cenocepacia]|nr:hypothetical protein A8E88_26140 [Burkholderia cenocepacia]ONV84236.1 hypothetical protein A8E89_27285 [Burkholderia cenocepacia]ONW07668.1 hypothetical protein A8E94_27555 [Burkholderia cenocepacia]ONW18575.1 hypothetical protein A8E90_13900 [Burkholderia cenocepacia]ONW34144.1 hypothetical protein A8E93_27625 [Burkholderia cenocepacia]